MKLFGIDMGEVWRYRNLALVVLGINLLLNICLGSELFLAHQNAFGQNLSIIDLIGGYDRTIYGDWLNTDSEQFTKITSKVVMYAGTSIGIQFLLNIGLVASIARKETKIVSFFKNIFKYFFPYLLMTLLFIFGTLILVGLVSYGYMQIFKEGFDAFRTELPLFYGAIGGVLIILLNGGIFWLLIGKAKLLRPHMGIRNSIIESAKWCKRNIGKLILLSVWMIIFFLLTSYLLNIILIYNSSKSYLMLIIFGLFGLLLIFCKILFKIWLFTTADLLK